MKLNVLERITLLQILPKEGTYVTFKILIDLKARLAFNEKEIKEFGVEENEGQIRWKKSTDKEIEVGEKATDIVVDVLKKLDKDGKINDNNVLLFEKFIKT